MGITIGTRLGPHEITGVLGRGGMGEVYRARDTNLKRDVAIKVLPDEFSRDPDRVNRFQREAEMLASLNHPNIAAIYDLEEANDTCFLVLELVDGETLAERIERGPLSVEEVLNIGKSICEALEAAHEKGIIHRDLKPANVKLTPDGKVKVLDFGLAKAFEPEAAAKNFSNSPTLVSGSIPGVILGTAAYMSPEQARGRVADQRSDVFAFGSVLYEMLTARQAFLGEDVSEVLASVLKSDPDLTLLPRNLNPGVPKLLRRCLEKNVRRRWYAVGDIRIEIEAILAEPAVVEVQHAERPRALWKPAIPILVGALLVAALVFMNTRSAAPPDSAAVRFTVLPPDKTVFEAGTDSAMSSNGGGLSPNGRKLAFTAKDESGRVLLWVRSLDTLAAQSLPATDGAYLPFWSPDSRSIAFFAQGKLKKINVDGGPPQTISDAENAHGGSWNYDGVIVFASTFTKPLSRVSSAGGEPALITKLLPSQRGHRFPSFLPDGRHFLYFADGQLTNAAAIAGDAPGVFMGALDSPEGQRLLAADGPAVYAPPGYMLFIRQGTLLAQPFDAQKLRLVGEPVPIAEQVAFDANHLGFSASENGALAYRTAASASNLQLVWLDRTGKLIEPVGVPGGYLGPDVSPDGKRIVIHRHDGKGGDVWLLEASGGKTSRLTFDASQENSQPIWSPDGSRIVFGSRRNGRWGLYSKASNGLGSEELLVESDALKTPMSWSADGKFVLYSVQDPKTLADVWALPLSGGRKPFPVLQKQFREEYPQISPDGKWFAYASNETGSPEVYVQSFPPGAGKWQISSNGGGPSRWRRDGKELFYLDSINSGRMFSVVINATESKFEFSAPRPLFDSGYYVSRFAHDGPSNIFAVSPDGQRFLIPRPESNLTGAANTPITIVLNWTATLRKK
jgi:serine/threonine protein kinase